MLTVTRKSMVSGVERSMELDIAQEDLDRWEKGEGLIQEIFPGLTPDQREFIMTGITSEEWDEEFGEPTENTNESVSRD